MFQNTLTGWWHPLPPKYKSHENLFVIVFQQDHIHQWTDGSYRYFRQGIEYQITGIRHGGSGLEVMLNDSRIISLMDLSMVEVICKTVSNSWKGEHTPEYDINKRNAKARRDAIRSGKRAYGFYVDEDRQSQPVFYVPTRPGRNQPNVLVMDADTAMMHATIQQPTPADIDGKEEMFSKHPLTDRREYKKPAVYKRQNDATRL